MARQRHYVQKPSRAFFIVSNVKNQKAIAFKLKVFFYCLKYSKMGVLNVDQCFHAYHYMLSLFLLIDVVQLSR